MILHRLLVPAAVGALALVPLHSAHAQVVVTAWSPTSLTVDWTNPTECDPPPVVSYQICWKEADKWWQIACNQHSEVSSQKPYTITGLSPNTWYKIVVRKFAANKNYAGNCKNPKYREVGEILMWTSTVVNSFAVTAATPTSLTAVQTVYSPSSYNMIRIGYKKKSKLFINLQDVCEHLNKPQNDWGSNNSDRGWFDFSAPQESNSVVFSGLDACTKYNLVVYGFQSGSNTGTKIGELTTSQTTGTCKTFFEIGTTQNTISPSIAVDHPEILDEYATALGTYYGLNGSVLDSLAAMDPSMYEQVFLLGKYGEEPLVSNMNLLEYSIKEQWETFEAWQESDVELAAAGLTLPAYVEANYPDLYAALIDESSNPPIGCGLLGDINGDCVVDGADLGIILSTFGSAGPLGDLNGDGSVDGADIGVLLASWS